MLPSNTWQAASLMPSTERMVESLGYIDGCANEPTAQHKTESRAYVQPQVKLCGESASRVACCCTNTDARMRGAGIRPSGSVAKGPATSTRIGFLRAAAYARRFTPYSAPAILWQLS